MTTRVHWYLVTSVSVLIAVLVGPAQATTGSAPDRTRLVSNASGGTHGNGTSQNADISLDGNSVVFESVATNYVPRDTNKWQFRSSVRR